ncbi:hypothetical protein R1flu_009828 [Riccia fluitans]|uniref:Tyrosyl-DNA phosphodiesterase 1 n=1 Tax=Riccia fluitans TaxID=41844 RepID=A0ABD1Z3K1_9MARC
MKAPIARLVALKDGDVDDSVPPLSVYEGLNTYGRNDCSLFSKHISREHVRIDAWPECKRFDVYVVGPNPVVVISKGKKERLGSQEWTSTQLSDIICFLPNEFPFRIDNMIPEINTDPASDVTTPIQVDEGKGKILVTADESGFTRKRRSQHLEDEAVARELQEEEDKKFAESLAQGSSTLRFSDTDRPDCKLQKTDTASNSSASTFHLLRTIGLPRSANNGCVRIDDVIEGDLLFVVLSNYMVDLSWLLPACPVLYKVPVVMIHGESGRSFEELNSNKPSNWFLHKPPLPLSYGTHHSKAMLLVYSTGVRVVVHTANLVAGDWNYKTQGLWMQDFPFKGACKPRGFRTNTGGLKTESEFETELVDYLRHLHWKGCTVEFPGTGETRVDAGFFKLFDYSTATVRLVASVPGYHSGTNLLKYGHMKLRSVLAELEFDEEFESSPLVFQFSSLGSLDEKWISELKKSMSAGRSSTKKPLGEGSVLFVWPTVEDIRCSLEGYAAGGSVPSPEKNIKPFLSKYWAKWRSDHVGRCRAMPHIKTYARYKGQSLAWVLLTSSNLSKAAWGALQKNGTQLMIRSYELGVLFLPSYVLNASGNTFSCTGKPYSSVKGGSSRESLESRAKLVSLLWDDGRNVSESVIRLPVPYSLPPPRYEEGDVPWAWDREYTKPDVYGQVRL